MLALLVLTPWLLAPLPSPPSPGGSQLALYGGYHGIGEAVDSGQLGVEVRLPEALWDLQPVAGFLATSDSAEMVYGGVRREFDVGNGFRWSPSTSIGHYDRGNGAHLGNHLMFRLGFDVTRTFGPFQVGVGAYHLSNAGTGEFNPGVETLLLTVSYRF